MSGDRNRAALARDERQERFRMLALGLPAFGVIGAIVIAPILRVLWLSLLDAGGYISLANYGILVSQGANVTVIMTTLKVSLIVTAVSVLVGYPLTYFLVQIPPRIATLCMIFVVLPYLTSVLVRTYAWMVLLGRHGIINDALIALGITDEPLPLMFNTTATVVGMVHMMLPLLVLPLYGSMRAIDRNCLRAAASLGASPIVAFWKVWFQLSLPGLAAGTFLIFVISLGFFITPTILGGGRVTMIAQQIATAMTTYSGFGVASALGIVLLVVTGAILAVVTRVVRIDLGQVQ
jgi:putative spermidine/putrescine transport system permease protein